MDEGEARPTDEVDAIEGASERRDGEPRPDEASTTDGPEPEVREAGEADADEDTSERIRATGPEGTETAKNAETEGAPEAAEDTCAGNTEADAARRRPSPRRGRRAVKAVVRSVVALLSVAALGVTGYAYSTLDALQDNVTTTDALRVNDDDAPDDEPPPPEDDGATDILLVGTDSRTDMEGNPLPPDVLRQLRTEDNPGISTDTLIILRIPHDGSSPTGISIPRDTWVAVPGGDRHAKINSVYGEAKYRAANELRAEGVTDRAEVERESAQAGRAALVRTVQKFTRIRIDHYAEVNLLGFYLLTETLGGVEVCLNHATSDPDSGANFAAGVQTVSGGEALSFVRQRKNLPRGDLDRIQRQQVFLASALNKVLSAGTLTDADRLEKLAATLRKSLVLDSELDLLKFAQQTRGIASGDFSFVTIPVVDIAAWSPDGKQSIVQVDVEEVRKFVADTVSADKSSTREPSGGGSAPRSASDADTEITADSVPCVN
ncbi:LCP family protein [Saccharomonospora glauca]|uniref:Cell envelope-related function transcriptional attenuator common domain n=1 Tax=Saccharomonospora glauca K62 TaxID=928724 RepID=I1CY46_9PSEU|nr:LCP family protein [Saccharomonospora glauca]EIE97620.1 cell envelope-related function transcriptional attenuator common domain [Saccharomonospora glauca K62]